MVGHVSWDCLIRNEGACIDWKIHSDSDILALLVPHSLTSQQGVWPEVKEDCYETILFSFFLIRTQG